MKLATYVIGQGDTLEILSQKLLGDPTQEDLLIQINQLRYPFISDNPADQFSRPKGNVYLTQSYNNPSTITVNNPNGIVIRQNDTVFCMEGMTNSSAVVQSVAGSSITLSSPLTGTFDQAATVTIFSNQQNVTSQVLKTGDTLLYPAASSQIGAPIQSNNLVLGTDWALDSNGYLIKSNGDIGTVSGISNLVQAIILRFQTPAGGLMLHPAYGNQLFNVLGESGETYFKGLAKYYIEECARQDPRIIDANVTDLTVDKDTIIASVTLTPIGSQSPVSQRISIPIGGVF